MRIFPEYFRGVAVVLLGSGITVGEIFRAGSVLMTFLGGALAVLGGLWAYRASRAKALTAEIELRRAQKEEARLAADSRWPL
jgi:hypothetical protein